MDGILHIGYGHYVLIEKLVSLHPITSEPIKKSLRDASVAQKVFDATHGKKTRSVLLMTSGNLILTTFNTEAIVDRLKKHKEG